MALKTRKPTGRVPWPLILVEGPEKAGKSWMCAELSASDKVGQTYWIDLGEGSADEYGAISGARYEIVEHDGTFAAMLAAVEDVKAEAAKVAAAGEPPVVVVIDSGTAEWELLKGQADHKARVRLAKKGRRVQPDDTPTISTDLWNDANAKHRKLMTHLMTFPGIAVVTARGKWVASIGEDGKPVEGRKEYRVEGQKGLAFDASVWIRVSRDHSPQVVGARSVHAGIRPGVDEPREVKGLTLEAVVFEVLKCDPKTAHVRDLVEPQLDEPEPSETPQPSAIRDWAVDKARTVVDLQAGRERLGQHKGLAEVVVMNETGDEETLADLFARRIAEMQPPEPPESTDTADASNGNGRRLAVAA